MNNATPERVERLCAAIKDLSDRQVDILHALVEQLKRPYISLSRLESSDIINECMLTSLGDTLRIHHSFSREAFSKDKFEYAVERTMQFCGLQAELAPRGNPGHDITIGNQRVSLKTQADRNIKVDRLHISKFMELGKGVWQLELLREQFFQHMENYERILILRCLSRTGNRWHYELVEIPKSLLDEARGGQLHIMELSKQNPKPGYCDVTDSDGAYRFRLYFDGGTERKLQVKELRKNLCVVHAHWIFATEEPLTK